MSRIFLSHSSSNNAEALALASWLHAQGWDDYFLDISETRGIAPGERWMGALAGAVDRCEAVIFLVSPAWRDSKFCFAEFFQAKNLGKRIFGVIVEPIALSQLPEQMTAEWQVCDLTHGDDPVAFTVERVPLVPRTEVRFPGFALEALARGLRKAGLDPSNFVWPPAADRGRSPYPGLRALDEPDAAVFFGREASIVRAVDQIRLVRERHVEHVWVILGASGSGKSSFLRAGLLPRLRRDSEHFVVLPPIRPERAAMTGSQGLLASLKSALAEAGHAISLADLRSELASTRLVGILRRIESRLHSPATAANAAQPAASRTVLIPIDQAEELFASDGADEAELFLQHVEALRKDLVAGEKAGEAARPRVLFIVTIRSDSLPRLQAHAVMQRLSPALFSLPAMPASEFKAVIEGPARRHTETVKPLVLSPQLVEELVADATGADALPLLALTLEWLYFEFTTPQGTRIGHDEYARLGGMRGVIDAAVKRALQDPARSPAIPAQRADQEQLLGQVFPYIATVDPDTGASKRRIALRSTLRAAAPQADALVQRLVEQRLLLSDARKLTDDGEPVEVVEVAHEALLRQWDALQRWLRAFAADLALSESIRRAAMDWQRGGRDEALLVHTAHRLQAAEALQADERLKGRFEPLDAEYLGACRERDRRVLQEREDQLRQMAEQQAKRATLQRRFTWGLSAVAMVVLFLLAWIVWQTRDVSRQTSLVLASAAEAAANRNEWDRGVRLAVLANRATWLRPAHANARPALSAAADGNAMQLLLAGHASAVVAAEISADGKRVVTASEDKTARLWDAATGQLVGVPMQHQGGVMSASFSADGQRVVTASYDMSARIWDAQTGQPVGAPMSHAGPVRSAAFSADRKRVVTASWDRTARVWDAVTGQPVGEPMLHEKLVWAATFSADGKRVVTASADKTARVWDAVTGQPVGPPMAHDEWVWDASFDASGRHVVTASADRTARVWDAVTGQPVGAPLRHDGQVYSASFRPDGKHVVTTSADKTARVWDAQTGQPVGAPMAHEGEVRSASFSADGTRVATASWDKTARIWDARTGSPVGAPLRHDDRVRSVGFSADGKRVVTASEDRTARVWDAETGQSDGAPMTHDAALVSAHFSADGRRVVTASADKSARVWDVDTGQPGGVPMRHQGAILSARFSADGRRAVTASEDKTARVWDAGTGQPVGMPMTHDGPVRSASFSTDGKRIVTASGDKTARVWDAESGRPVGSPMAHDRSVWSASFSIDGKRIVTASADKTARLWDAESGLPIGAPMVHEEPVHSASFSTDGKRIVTESEAWTARVWDADTGLPVGGPMPHTAEVLSASFSADGKRLVTASWDKTARVWDVGTGQPVGAPMTHDDRVVSASFSADGKRVLTASYDKTARIWDAETGTVISAPMTHGDRVRSASFSADGKRVLTASEDKTARVWRKDLSQSDSSAALMSAACASMNPAARRITPEDREWAPVIPPRLLGRDVCELAGAVSAG